jgi:hypothetical protein
MWRGDHGRGEVLLTDVTGRGQGSTTNEAKRPGLRWLWMLSRKSEGAIGKHKKSIDAIATN